VSSPSRYRSPRSKKLYFTGSDSSYVAWSLKSTGSWITNSSCKGGTIDDFLFPNLFAAVRFGDFDGRTGTGPVFVEVGLALGPGFSIFGHL